MEQGETGGLTALDGLGWSMGAWVTLWVQGQHGAEEVGGDFLVEARDWAGELISAQTTMGKILVGRQLVLFVLCFKYFFIYVEY